jgi:hypothetical protein
VYAFHLSQDVPEMEVVGEPRVVVVTLGRQGRGGETRGALALARPVMQMFVWRSPRIHVDILPMLDKEAENARHVEYTDRLRRLSVCRRGA